MLGSMRSGNMRIGMTDSKHNLPKWKHPEVPISSCWTANPIACYVQGLWSRSEEERHRAEQECFQQLDEILGLHVALKEVQKMLQEQTVVHPIQAQPPNPQDEEIDVVIIRAHVGPTASARGSRGALARAMVVSLFKGRRLHLWATCLLRSHAATRSPTGLRHGMVAGTLFLCGSWLSCPMVLVHWFCLIKY